MINSYILLIYIVLTIINLIILIIGYMYKRKDKRAKNIIANYLKERKFEEDLDLRFDYPKPVDRMKKIEGIIEIEIKRKQMKEDLINKLAKDKKKDVNKELEEFLRKLKI